MTLIPVSCMSFGSHTQKDRDKNPLEFVCEACRIAKAKRQVSRVARPVPQAVLERVAIDFHDFVEDDGGFRRLMLCTDRYSNFSWDFYMTDKKPETIEKALREFFGVIYAYGVGDRIRVVETDGEIPGSQKLRICHKPSRLDMVETGHRS